MPYRFLDQAAQAQLEADLERLFCTMTGRSPVQHAALRTEVLRVIASVEGKLIRPQWQDHWRSCGAVMTSGFDDDGHDAGAKALHEAEADALHNVFTELVRYVLDATTPHRKEKYVAQLAEALRDYFSLKGYGLPPPSKTMGLEEASSTVQADSPRDQTGAGHPEGAADQDQAGAGQAKGAGTPSELVAVTDGGNPANRQETIQRMPPSVRKAYLALLCAERKAEKCAL